MPKDIHVPARIIGGKISVKATLGQTVIVTEGPETYTGPVTVTPTESEQVLQTKDKLVTDNISVNPIPSEYVKNGITLDEMADHSGPVIHNPVINADKVVQYAFKGCTGFSGVLSIPNATECGSYAFEGCSGITEIYAPKVVAIAGFTFSLKNDPPNQFVNIYLDSLKVLPQNACGTRAKLILHMPVVEEFGTMCFNGAYGYLSANDYFVTIPASVKKIGSDITRNTGTFCVGYKFYGKPDSIDSNMVGTSKGSVKDIYVPWSEGEVPGAPWGGTNATVHYNTVYDADGNVVSST